MDRGFSGQEVAEMYDQDSETGDLMIILGQAWIGSENIFENSSKITCNLVVIFDEFSKVLFKNFNNEDIGNHDF